MLQNLGTISVVLLTSHLLFVIQQCAGSFDGAICKNNKGTINIRDDEGSCKCSVDPSHEDGYRYLKDAGAYKYYKEPKTWNEARKICESEGAHLAVLDSEVEKRELIIFNLYNKIQHTESTSRKPTSDDHFWLGIHDQYQEGDWNTVLGEPLGYAPWSASCYDKPQPDNTGGQNCGTIVTKCEEMDDVQCNWILPFYCEKPHTCL